MHFFILIQSSVALLFGKISIAFWILNSFMYNISNMIAQMHQELTGFHFLIPEEKFTNTPISGLKANLLPKLPSLNPVSSMKTPYLNKAYFIIQQTQREERQDIYNG